MHQRSPIALHVRVLIYAGHAALVLAFLGLPTLYFVSGGTRQSLSFTPTIGSMGGRWLVWFLALLVTALVSAARSAQKAASPRKRTNEDDGMGALVLCLLVLYCSLLTTSASWELLHSKLPSQHAESTVLITATDVYPDEPDCVAAYHFNNSADFDSWVCAEDKTPLKVGAKVLVVESTNWLGISILKFTPDTSPSVAR